MKKIYINININQQMSEPFVIPPVSAGSSNLISELYSEQKLNKDVVDAL